MELNNCVSDCFGVISFLTAKLQEIDKTLPNKELRIEKKFELFKEHFEPLREFIYSLSAAFHSNDEIFEIISLNNEIDKIYVQHFYGLKDEGTDSLKVSNDMHKEVEDAIVTSEICKEESDIESTKTNVKFKEKAKDNKRIKKRSKKKRKGKTRVRKKKSVVEEIIECPICLMDYPESMSITLSECQHTYCTNCVTYYLNTKINERKVLNIVCPSPTCNSEIEYSTISEILDSDTFEKYDRFTFLAALDQDENCKWCPKPGCGNAIFADPDTNKVVCNSCNHEFCFHCAQDYHIGTCEEFKEWEIENENADKKFKDWKNNGEEKRRCPKCKIYITKEDGCNHMTCPRCNHNFCWLCGKKYTSNHFSPYNLTGCPFMMYLNKSGNAKRITLKILLGAGYVVGGCLAIALSVPILVIGGPVFGFYKLHKHRKEKKRRTMHWNY